MAQRKLDRDLVAALGKGDFVAARELIGRGADINTTSRMSADSTLLWLAVNSAGGEISKSFQDLATGVAEYLETPQRDHTPKGMSSFDSLGL